LQNPPDLLIVDNPKVAAIAADGGLVTTVVMKADTAKIEPNLLTPGRLDGEAYGVPLGANTQALFYNKKILRAAGVDATSIKSWASLTSALSRVQAAGSKGITFSGAATEEGTAQFLPWYWGAGGKLPKLDSASAVSALSLWTGWLRSGYAGSSVASNTPDASWKEFVGGNYAFAENSTSQVAAAKASGLDWGVIPIPARKGGAASAPTGGEFLTMPAQVDLSRYLTTQKIVACLTGEQNLLTADAALSDIAPTKAGQHRQIASDSALRVPVRVVNSSRARTSDEDAATYPTVSQSLWTAVQAALTGSKTPRSALTAAQQDVTP
jgi:multiple sugar transport system substrate-binding protein